MLTKCQALQYGHSGILCVAIDPGDVEAAPGRQEVRGGGGVPHGHRDTGVPGPIDVVPPWISHPMGSIAHGCRTP